MTWVNSAAVWETTDDLIPEPKPCAIDSTVCKDGYVIPCETKYGADACWAFFADDSTPVSPEPETVPAPPGGLLLATALALFVAVRRWRT